MTIIEAYTEFMEEQKFRNNTEKTISCYETNLTLIIDWLTDQSTTEALTLENYKKYVIYLNGCIKKNGEKLSSATVNTSARSVKAFYNYYIENDIIPDFSRKLRSPKVYENVIEILSDEEVRQLLVCFGTGKTEMRNKCWCVLMLDSGLRRSECLKIKCGDVSFAKRCIIINGKGRKQRYIPLGDNSLVLLREFYNRYCSSSASSSPMFTDRFGNKCTINTIKQVFQKLKKRCGIERLHPHLLRHTFATMYLADGGDLETLRIILGHSDIQVTQVYLHLASDYKLISQKHLSHFDKIIGVM